MPTHKQNTVEVPSSNRGNGSSETKNLQDIFPGSPIHSGELTDEVVRDQGQKLLVDGVVLSYEDSDPSLSILGQGMPCDDRSHGVLLLVAR